MSNNIRSQYNPARIYHALSSNTGHIKKNAANNSFSFIDRPPSPIEPVPPNRPNSTVVKDWKPIGWTIFLVACLLVPKLNIFAAMALVGLWGWAFLKKLPKYKVEKQVAASRYQNLLSFYKKKLSEHKELLKIYEAQKKEYWSVTYPQWEKSRSAALEEAEKIKSQLLHEALQKKGWTPIPQWEVDKNYKKGYIGKGEDDLVAALARTNIAVCHQVKIQKYYTADIVCLCPLSGKLCVVEIDGHQHWSKSDQIRRDEERMSTLAIQGVPTIRFINTFAESNPDECVKYIQFLLKP
jgi:very-short-patch-repair endonuclease